MKSFLFAIAILCSLPSQIIASTCPPPPMPLRYLVPISENILIGHVLSMEEITLNSGHKGLQAEFEVHQVLQGKIKTKTIPIFMEGWVEQLMGESTTDEGRMLVFVNLSDEDGKRYFSSSYQSSFKMLDEAGLKVYKQRIKELQAINTLKDETRREGRTVDWLIDCASNHYTYWEGAYDLSSYGGFLQYYDYEKEELVERIALSATQKQRLKEIVLNRTEITYLELSLIPAITDGPDPELLRFMIKTLKLTDAQYLYQQQALMGQIALMTKRQDLSDSLDQIRSLAYDDDHSKKVNTIAKDFINKL